MNRFDPYLAKTREEALENIALARAELERRKAFDLKKFCHPKQYDFVMDPAPYATAVTSRRAGKTVACAADLLNTGIKFPGSTGLYITLSRANAKIILWPIIKGINEKYKLGFQVNESDLSLKRNDSNIYLSGIKDSSEIEKYRGMALKKVYLDEMQSMRSYVKELVDDVLDPACIDHNGQIRAIGTPGPVPVGYFHDVATGPEWKHHFFTIWDNPFIQNAKDRLELVLKRRGLTMDDPSIQREWFGKWSLDLSALVFRYDPTINDYNELPSGIEWEYIVVADFGFDDADAIAAIAFSIKHPTAYLVEEKITTKQGITPLANQLLDFNQRYKPMKILGDFGALGKKIAEELQTRFSIPIEAAEKSRKLEFIELTNDSLRTGRLKAKKGSRFAQDAMLLEWDLDNPEKPKISDRYHSDIGDCVLYGHRELLHWLWKEEVPAPKPGTIEFMKQEEEDIWNEFRDKHNREKNEQRMYDMYNEYDT